jgi:hypothetical protein
VLGARPHIWAEVRRADLAVGGVVDGEGQFGRQLPAVECGLDPVLGVSDCSGQRALGSKAGDSSVVVLFDCHTVNIHTF